MSDLLKKNFQLPPEQQASSDKCFRPSGTFVEFRVEDLETSIPGRFEKIARMFPDRLAVKDKDRAVTYDELNKAANRIAHAILEKRGPGSEPIVLLLEHGIGAITAIFAVLKAGKFYVALDPSFPKERLKYILNDSQAELIISNDCNIKIASEVASAGCALLNTDALDKHPVSNIEASLSRKSLAVITYTSGSTGAPKGAGHTHETLLSKFYAFSNQKQVSPDDRLSLLYSLSFSGSHGDFLISLLNGATLLPFDIKSAGVPRLAKWLTEERITISHVPVMTFRDLAKLLPPYGPESSLRLVSLSGAPITEYDFDLYKKTFSEKTQLEIGMGSTETGTICQTIIGHKFSFPKEGTPIGYPLPGKTVLLIDENGQEVGFDQVGEIAVKSSYLSNGYWNKPELSAAKFLPDVGGVERIYLTGDFGKKLPNGFFIHLGRKDLMVKIRGYRVELAEIEKALLAHPQVKEAGIAAWERDPGEKYLVGYIVPRQAFTLNVSELNAFLRKQLPEYMVPSTLMFLDSLPLINGKLDRSALPKPDSRRPDLIAQYVSPNTETEKRLCLIWSEVLSLDQVGIQDNFFDLGGHSLAASRIISRVIQTFQLELPLKTLFDAPTVAEMAAVITSNGTRAANSQALVRMLKEVEALSEEEAQKQLAKKSQGGDNIA